MTSSNITPIREMTYVIDLDHTLCVPNANTHDSYERYALAKPIPEMISYVRRLYRDGHTIIIHTARRMLTHKGDLEAIEADVGNITRGWLFTHGVPHHQLIFGKPYGDFYVDDKALNVKDVKHYDD